MSTLTIEKKPLNVGKYVNTQHVDEVIRNYKQERWVQNSEKIGKEDSLSIWWSIDEMESFIETAKTNGADGLKFYFGAYSKNYKDVPEYAERQTLVMVATKEKQTMGGAKNKDIYLQTENGSNILAYNRGVACPPKCGTGLDIDSDSLELGITIIDRGDKGLTII